MKAKGRLVLVSLVLFASSPGPSRAAAPPPELAQIRAILEHGPWLADPSADAGPPATFGTLRVTSRLHAGEPRLLLALGAPDAAGRPQEATVTVQRWLTGTLEIRRADGRGARVRKAVRDSCARQLTLRRAGAPGSWRVTSASALVRATPSGRAGLPLVDLDTRVVSGGFLSTRSDLDELSVQPQTCAVTAAGDSVRVFVAGVDADASVCVFAAGRRVVARRRDASHLEAMLALDGPAGLRQIGVTVFPRRTLADPDAPADSRTWVMPILVGTPPAAAEAYFPL
jgi:hypothetical protein